MNLISLKVFVPSTRFCRGPLEPFSDALEDPSKFVGIGGVPNSGELGVFAQLSVL